MQSADNFYIQFLPGRAAQSVTCLATDACLTADPGVASSILVRSHTFVEIDHEMISTVILLPFLSGEHFRAIWSSDNIRAMTCDFQQCGILTSVNSDKPVQPLLKLRSSK